MTENTKNQYLLMVIKNYFYQKVQLQDLKMI